MPFLQRHKNLILIALLIVAIIPYFVVCFYALPFADDFCNGWTASENVSLGKRFADQYLHWNGRYAADVTLNFHPIVSGQLLYIQLTIFGALLSAFLIIYFFLNTLFRNTMLSVIVALSVLLFYLNYQPNITEGLYWFIGINNYLAGSILLILQIALLYQANQTGNSFAKSLLHLLSIACLIVTIGLNEIGALLIPVYYFAAWIINPTSDLRQRKTILFYFLIAIAASAFVFFSPGNFGREQEFPDRFNLLHSLYYSMLQTIRFTGTWALSVPFIVISLIVLSCADKIEMRWVKAIDYRVLLALLFFTVFTGSFLPYMGTGILGQHRTINYVFFNFIFLWLAFLVSCSIKFSLHEKLSFFRNDRFSFIAVIGSILVMMFTANGRSILNDGKANAFQDYKVAFMQRQADILAGKSSAIAPLKSVPSTFHIVDAKADSTWWVNKCMIKFYTETSIVLR